MRYGFKIFIENQWQKESNTQRFERNEKLILFFVLLFRGGIGFQRLRFFVCNCSTIVTPKKALFDVISLLGDLVIAYRSNLVVIMPKAVRTFHDQCSVHFSILTMFYFLLFLTVVVFSVVVALLGVKFNTILRSHFLLLLLLLLILPLLILNIQWTLLIITLVIGSIFCISVAFFLFY